MAFRAVLLDFYGTLVEEDDAVIARIVRRIASETAADPADLGRRWSASFAGACASAHGERFRTQREIELESLRELLDEIGSTLDSRALSEELFRYWTAPEPRPGAARFLDALALPAAVVSNIDTADLERALARLGWSFDALVTSESCRAYKPRPEMFEAALARLDCRRDEVLHVGDSLGSDVIGASRLGIATAWVNGRGRPLPPDVGVAPDHVVADVDALIDVLRG